MLRDIGIIQYFARLSPGKVVLWCYLIWYLSTVAEYFDPAPSIWLNSLGISLVIGVALLLSVGGRSPVFADSWQTFRLFFMPFAVSSFSALIKGRGFFLVFRLPWRRLPSSSVGALCLCLWSWVSSG